MAGGTLTVNNGPISNNTAGTGSPDGDGGGIDNNEGTTTKISNSTISGNHASDDGGGIRNVATLTLTNVTITNNRADNQNNGDAPEVGGGIEQFPPGSVTFVNSHVFGNSPDNCAGTPSCPP